MNTYTLFAHHNALHNEANRALLVTAVSLLVVVAIVVILALKQGGDK